ncbi:MAG: hypothetical protein ACOC1I_04815 [Spirochaetota bacterium]
MRRTTVLFLLLLAAMAAGALEVERGDIRLVLHDRSSRFSAYVRHEGDWVPLFFAEDPRTSGLDILENNQIHRMGDSGVFEQETELIEGGARFVWTSRTLRVVQSFLLTQGVRSDTFDALEMSITVTNAGEEPSRVGARLLFDTYLGEPSNTHFVTPGAERITRETALEPGPVNRYVASVPDPDAVYGFQVMALGDEITQPATIVVANWQRLSSAAWDYEVNQTRNFNRLPYSINDSAMAVLYEPEQLRGGEQYRVVVRLGDLSPEGYVNPSIAMETTGTNPLIARLSALIVQLNQLIEADEVDEEEVARLQAELDSLADLVRRR